MPTNLHPLFVHFPIALLLSSVALSWAGRLWQGKKLQLIGVALIVAVGLFGGELVYTFGVGVSSVSP